MVSLSVTVKTNLFRCRFNILKLLLHGRIILRWRITPENSVTDFSDSLQYSLFFQLQLSRYISGHIPYGQEKKLNCKRVKNVPTNQTKRHPEQTVNPPPFVLLCYQKPNVNFQTIMTGYQLSADFGCCLVFINYY